MANPKPPHLLVHVPKCSRHVHSGQTFPVLVFVDPPDAAIAVSVECHPSGKPLCNVQSLEHRAFNKIIWIDSLPEKHTHTLTVQATANNETVSCTCRIYREQPPKAKGQSKAKKKKGSGYGGGGDTPDIVFPTAGQDTPSFVAYGYVDPESTPVNAWLVDGDNNTWPGLSEGAMAGICDWSFSFGPLPQGNYTLYVEATPDGLYSTVDVMSPGE